MQVTTQPKESPVMPTHTPLAHSASGARPLLRPAAAAPFCLAALLCSLPLMASTPAAPQKGKKTGNVKFQKRSARFQGKFPKGKFVFGEHPGAPSSYHFTPTRFAGAFPGMHQPISPNAMRFSFEFHGSDIMDALSLFARMANKTVVADPSLSGNVTIINPTPVTLDQAFMILQQVLAARGFTAMENGNVINIVPFDIAGKNTPILNPGINDNGVTPVDPRDQVMTQVIPLDNVDATSLAKDLKPLVNKGASLVASAQTNAIILTDTASNVQRFIALAHALDKASDKTQLRVYPLQRAQASDLASIINDIYKQLSNTGASTSKPKPGQPFQPPGMPAAPTARPSVYAVADTRTNSLIVVASADNQRRVAQDIIARLDGGETNPLSTITRKIIYADASSVADLVNTVLSNQYGSGVSQGNGQPSFQNRVFGRFAFFNQQQNQNQQNTQSTDPFGKVVADPRTNSVFITASSDRMRTINNLIDDLDRPVPAEATTYVFPLKNAQASDVAYALSQAFGTNNNLGQGNNFFNFGGTGGTGVLNQPQKINRSLSSSNSPFGRSTSPPAPPNAPDSTSGSQNIPGVMTPNGFVPDTTTTAGGTPTPLTRQFFRPFFGGFGQQSRSLGTNSGPQYGRGRNGTYANLLNLQSNVYVTASPTGDSLIVTTTPDNYDAVKKLIEELDVVPRQVSIQLIVAQVTLTKDQKLGFSLSGLFQNLLGHTNTANGQINLTQQGFNAGTNGTTLDPTAAGGQFSLNGASYSALLQALEADTSVKVVATPRIFTSNGQEAYIDITQQIPYYGGAPTVSNGVIVPAQIINAQVGYQLDVTPRITAGGMVSVDLYTIASDLVQFETLGTGQFATQVPIINQRAADTEVTIQSGKTVAIGGLIQDTATNTVNRIPLLSDIPLIGQFFRSREHVNNRTELVIFMTPHVVASTDQADQMTRNEGGNIVKETPVLTQLQPNLNELVPPKKGTASPGQKKTAPANTGK